MTLEEQLEEGRRQWTIAWRRFARQWTQPQLLKLADAVLGGRYLHSSQISGFATGKLREPSPKVFVAIGRLNQAIAKSKIASGLKELLENKDFLKDKNGNPLDETGCFQAFTGQLDLGIAKSRYIPKEQVDEACKSLGRHLRARLAEAGIDFIEELHDITMKHGSHVRSILLGVPMDAEELVDALRETECLLLEKGIRESIDQLWEEVVTGQGHEGHSKRDHAKEKPSKRESSSRRSAERIAITGN